MKTLLPLKSLFAAALLTVSALSPSVSFAAEQEIDRVAAIVNSGVVLESEVKEMIKNIKAQAQQKGQELPSDNAIRIQVMDRLINESLIIQLGERMGVQISDAQLDETIMNMAKSNNMDLEQFRQVILNDGMDYESYRENVRKELVVGEVRRASVRRRVYISPQEVANLLSAMKEQTSQSEEYNIGHILIEFPPEPNQADLDAAKIRADKVIELLNTGAEFSKIAIASSGDANALEGGSLGWKTVNELPTLFAEVIDGNTKGDVFGPIRTGLGFSIVKILDIRGRETVEVEEVRSRHILIEPTIILSEAKAEEMLLGFLEQLKAGEADFDTLAKEHSNGPSASRGGDLGWSDPNKYDPAFKDTLATLKIDEYSKPFRSSFGWHLVQLTGRRMLDATAQMNENKAYQLLYNRKFGMESARWIKETRDEAYIEIFDQEQ